MVVAQPVLLFWCKQCVRISANTILRALKDEICESARRKGSESPKINEPTNKKTFAASQQHTYGSTPKY